MHRDAKEILNNYKSIIISKRKLQDIKKLQDIIQNFLYRCIFRYNIYKIYIYRSLYIFTDIYKKMMSQVFSTE